MGTSRTKQATKPAPLPPVTQPEPPDDDNEQSIQFRMGKAAGVHFQGDEAAYTDLFACHWELVRNGCNGCQVDDKSWDPKRVHVDIRFSADLPFVLAQSDGAVGSAMVIFDRGRGLDKMNRDRFATMGMDNAPNQAKKETTGVGQKRIGRFCAFALVDPKKPPFGEKRSFFVVTRYKKGGRIIAFQVDTSDLILREGDKAGVADFTTFAPDDPALVGIVPKDDGTFTALIIPNPVAEVRNLDRLREEMRRRFLPRGRHALDIRINGERIDPLPLPSHTRTYDGYVAYLEYVKGPTRKEGGRVWLCDEHTGFPVTTLGKLGGMGHDIGSSCIDGVIYAPAELDLLNNMDTTRRGLSRRFLGSDAWARALKIINFAFNPFANDLAHDHGRFGTDERDESVTIAIGDLHTAFGKPAAIGSYRNGTGDDPRQKPHVDKDPKKKRPRGGGPSSGQGLDDDEDRPLPAGRVHRHMVRIGERDWELNKQANSHDCFVEASIGPDGNRMSINSEKFQGFPGRENDVVEFIKTELINAAAQTEIAHEMEGQAVPPPDVITAIERRRGGYLLQLRKKAG